MQLLFFTLKIIQLLYAVGTDILAAQGYKVFRAFAKYAGRLILAENNIISLNINF